MLKIHAEGMGLGMSFTVYMKGRMIGKEKESERDLPSADPLLKCPCVSGLDQAETRSQELCLDLSCVYQGPRYCMHLLAPRDCVRRR